MIVAIGGDVAPVAKRATQTIPLVFVSSADPEQLGLVASLGRPGGNATGITLLQDALATKRLELLKDMTLVKYARLSVQPVTDAEWAVVCEMGGV